jgi:hypothetical protein
MCSELEFEQNVKAYLYIAEKWGVETLARLTANLDETVIGLTKNNESFRKFFGELNEKEKEGR